MGGSLPMPRCRSSPTTANTISPCCAATVWTPVPGQFTTSALNLPAVALNPVQAVSDRSAVVTGAVTDAGGEQAAAARVADLAGTALFAASDMTIEIARMRGAAETALL